jgi:UDPglucose 6-dehydrogenase
MAACAGLTGICLIARTCQSAEADVNVVVTEWNEFRAPDLNQLRGKMRGNVLVDLRNAYLQEQAHSSGFTYLRIGR